jgi:FtsP/CotA-like multicopper oxidase with cupredoxin domain
MPVADYSTQYTDGVTGALIVHGMNETIPAYASELVIELSDLYHGFSTDLLRRYLSVRLFSQCEAFPRS